jgi:apolipoprotein N-acyltransferase
MSVRARGFVITTLLIFCSAALFYFSFPNFLSVKGAPFCAWGCVLPFLWVLDGRRVRDRFLLGLVWGLLSHGFLVSWLMPVSIGGWALFVGALAVQGAVFALLFPIAVTSFTAKLFLIPCAWVASEWVRTFILGGFSWSLGYSQAPVPEVIQIATLGGVYAVAWVLVFANTAIYLVVRTRGQRNRFWLVPVLVMALAIFGGALRILLAPPMIMSPSRVEHVMRVAAVQPNISREEKVREDLYDAHALRHMGMTKKAVTAGWLGAQDLVVWPETAFTDDILTDTKWRPRLEAAARSMGVNILVGSALLWDGRDLNSAILLSAAGDWKSVYHKMRLVPFSEFTPRGAERIAASLHIGKYRFSAGVRPGNMVLPGGKAFGVVICSEEFYPEMFEHLTPAKPQFVVVMLNDGWFARQEALYLHALAAPLRAVESGLPVVRVANTGRTCAFDAYGRKIGRSPDAGRSDVAVYDMPAPAGRTLYAKCADLFALMCLVFVIMMRALVQVQRSKNETPHAD